jgi:imidazolonepropionase-like amidohydrolase
VRSRPFWLVPLLLAGLATLATLSGSQQPQTDALALVGGRIFTSPTAEAIDDGVIIIRNGKIAEVGPRRSVNITGGSTTINCSGKVITAGFQNSHVHFMEEKWNGAERQPASKLSEQLNAMLLRYGFTTVVDTGSLLPNTIALRRRIEAHDVVGPRILTAGVPLYPPNGIPYYVKDGAPPDLIKLLPQPSTPAEAIGFVRQNLTGGADIVKLFTGSWINKTTVMTMPNDVAAAAVTEAHQQGKIVFTHPSNVAGLEVALRAHVDVLAHGIEDTRGFTADHIHRMAAQKMALIPTLHLFSQNTNIDDIRREVRDHQQAGGQILFGTDAGFVPDYDPTDEYVQMARAGLTWRQILASLTTNPAARLREASRRGQLAKGQDADIVVLGSDPSNDVRAFASVSEVIRSGRIIFQNSQRGR